MILGLLRYEPLSGYGLKQVFDTPVQHVWPADQSQIYRILGRLAEQGWAEMDVEEQVDRPSCKVHSITEAGQEELCRWLTVPLAAHGQRSAPLRATVERYEEVPAAAQACVEEVGSLRETLFWMLTLECGVKMMESQLARAAGSIERSRSGEHPAA